MIDPEVTSLHTAFVIIYLQELAWLSAPLLISANVFLHACLRKLELGILVFSGSIFAFFLVSGISISISLYFVHTRALGRKQVRYLTPYILAKIFRMLVLGTFSVVILLSPKLIKTYFYASIYGLFECVAGAIALEAILTASVRRLLAHRAHAILGGIQPHATGATDPIDAGISLLLYPGTLLSDFKRDIKPRDM